MQQINKTKSNIQNVNIMATKVLSYLLVLLVIFLDIITAYYCIEQMILHPVFLDVKIMSFVVMSFTLGVWCLYLRAHQRHITKDIKQKAPLPSQAAGAKKSNIL